MIILDTNVLSELMKIQPDPKVVQWLDSLNESLIWTTTITIFEIQYGLMMLPAGKKRKQLQAAFQDMLHKEYQGRILPFDEHAAIEAGNIAAELKTSGQNIDSRDIQIAAITLTKGATLATRNAKDFPHPHLKLMNPWG